MKKVEKNNKIEFSNVYKFWYKKKYGNKEIVLKNLNISLESSSIYALVGKNGSGKTTIFKIIRQLVDNYYGTVSFNNENSREEKKYLEKSFFMDSEFDSLKFSSNYKEISEMLDLQNNYIHSSIFSESEFFKKYLEDKQEESIFTLSTGWKKVILLSKLLRMKKIDYLFLDEPFEGLDFEFRDIIIEKILNLVKNGTLAIISSHNLSDLENLTEKIIFIKNGKVEFFGSAKKIKDILKSNDK